MTAATDESPKKKRVRKPAAPRTAKAKAAIAIPEDAIAPPPLAAAEADPFAEHDPFAESLAFSDEAPAFPDAVSDASEPASADAAPEPGMPAGPGLIELAAVLDRNAAPGLHGGLLGLRGSPLTIDASKVERIGGQCAQVLLSAAATWQADGQPLSLVEPSAGFERDLQLLGLGVHDFLTTETAP